MLTAMSPIELGETQVFTLGVDFGTNSVRALVVRASDGAEYGAHVFDYPSGAQGVLLDPKDGLLARQHPGDYLTGLEESIRGALAEASGKSGFERDRGEILAVKNGIQRVCKALMQDVAVD